MMEKLNEKQLRKLYFDYVKYRDSLPIMVLPIGVEEFYVKNKKLYDTYTE